MKRLSLIVLLVVMSAVSVLAQGNETAPLRVDNTAPVVWERYEIDDHYISFLMPKLPVIVSVEDPCVEADTYTYYAYAERVVYEVRFTYKHSHKLWDQCPQKKLFSSKVLDDRLSELRTDKLTQIPTAEIKDGRKVYKFTEALGQRVVYDDPAKQRFIEFATYKNSDAASSDDFMDSVRFTSSDGIKIGNGSAVTIGDKEVKQPPSGQDPKPITNGAGNGTQPAAGVGDIGVKQPSSSGAPITVIAVTSPLTLISKPRARYTNDARNAKAEGTVVLKVTLLTNGSVGYITVVTPLDYGLTEQAISAARRLVFLPKLINGYPVSVSKIIEYNFNIY